MDEVEGWIDELERRLPDDDEAYLLLSQLRDAWARSAEIHARLDRSRQLLTRTVRLLGRRGLVPAAEQILDLMLELLGAKRGFLGLVAPDGSWDFLAARHLDRATIEDPAAETSRTVLEQVLEHGAPVVLHDASTSGPLRRQASVMALKLRSVACFPLPLDPETGFVYLDNPEAAAIFDPVAIETLEAWLPALCAVLSRERLQPSARQQAFPGLVTRSQTLQGRLRELARVARFDVPVLLHGETGTGKTMLARLVHESSGRAGGPFVHVNCSAIPAELLEGELFGAERGAYTGADRPRAGTLEAAAGGTVFLDELDAMPLACQAKLLLAVQHKRVTRLGSTRSLDIDVRFMAALGSDPQTAISSEHLREDLFYRLGVIVTRLPPLRERPEDVRPLAEAALHRAVQRYDLGDVHLTAAAIERMQAHCWPGNVRELENCVDRAALLCTDGAIDADDLSLSKPGPLPATRVRRRRGRVPKEEFETAWRAQDGDIREIAFALGIAERSVHRLRARFIDP